MSRTVACKIHGVARPAYVCCHLFASLATRTPEGLRWLEDDDGDLQAFCDGCWTADDAEFERRNASGPRLICVTCLDEIAAINNTSLDFGTQAAGG